MVLLAASVSLRFFRFGGVQKMVLGGIGAGFLLYVLSKVTDDLSKAGLLAPWIAAWTAARRWWRDRPDRAAVPGGRVMAPPATRPRSSRRRTWCGALVVCAAAIMLVAGSAGVAPPLQAQMLTFPPRPKPAGRESQRPGSAEADARSRR